MEIIRLKEVAKITAGKTPLTTNERWWNEGKINWYTGKDISQQNKTTNKKITDISVSENSQRLTTDKSILLSILGNLEVYLPKQGVAYNQQVVDLTPNENLILRKYLYYLLKISIPRLSLVSTSSIFLLVNTTTLKNFKILLPNLHKQQEIIDIIESV